MRLSTKLELLCVPAPASSTDSTAVSANGSPDLEPAAAYAHSVLRTLADVLAAKVDAGHADVAKYADRLAPRLFALFAGAAFLAEDTPGGAVAADARLLAVAAQIVTLITQTLGAPRQEAFVKAVFGAFVEGNLSELTLGAQKVPEGKRFAPLQDGASTYQKNLLVLFSATVVALHKEVGGFAFLFVRCTLLTVTNRLYCPYPTRLRSLTAAFNGA